MMGALSPGLKRHSVTLFEGDTSSIATAVTHVIKFQCLGGMPNKGARVQSMKAIEQCAPVQAGV
jgi:hypothetical protein